MTPGALWIMVMAGICMQSSAVHLRNMEHFITAVAHLEHLNPQLSSLALVSNLCQIADQTHNVTHGFMRSSNNETETHPKIKERLNINLNLSHFFSQALHHFITAAYEEKGVVLTPDGTTVALAPLLLGLESGLRAENVSSQPNGFYLHPLARTLGLSFLNSTPTVRLGAEGCWDSVSAPMVFTLSNFPSLVTDAVVHGGMDGAILGKHLSVVNCSKMNVSTLLRSYYLRTVEELDDVLDPHLKGRNRRQNFQKITSSSLLQEKVAGVLPSQGDAELESLIAKGIKEFVLRYMAIPSKPCLNLQTCSQNMRAMQRFHQKDWGWYDIGYSFVVGSDGYIYEGRGWMSQGAHTKGRNNVGYGVAFIGDYSGRLPSTHDMELVRHHLVKCGVNNGFLQEDFTILGHRQVVVTTSCPGNALYSEITTWMHYKDKDPLK
uniref:Peptidoglycan recognition protein 2 n=1 Tax=Danio rerio TaxID=7955 RepID=A5GZR3_DANRE|nr:peptidoglycan recognition protein 2 isoform X1 [Danio rerio]ABF50497.1 peptidoglycan recognition protein long [Danio rerio]|eukprot:XP_021332584.1 peptidoglycan recognition protein 2 isoform X1 [Danio rerio]